MPMREFRDSRGVDWLVWEVIVASEDRRRLRDRRARPRKGLERRKRLEPPLLLSRGRADGWLAFESTFERRRLRPIPKNWDTLTDAQLEALLSSAVPGRRPRRLLD